MLVLRRTVLCRFLVLGRRSAPLRRGGRSLCPLCLVVLLYYGVMRLVFVLLTLKHGLLLRRRISITGVLPLVCRQRRTRGCGVTIPMVPIASTLLPFIAPVVTPVRRRVGLPPAKIRRRATVVANRDAQYVKRNGFGDDQPPRSVVPGARVPVVRLVDPIHAVIEEVVRAHSRRVIDGVSGHRNEFRVDRQVDSDGDTWQPDADAHLGRRRGDAPTVETPTPSIRYATPVSYSMLSVGSPG